VRAFPQPQSNDRRLRYTHVPNCACRGRTGKPGDVPGGLRKCERRIRKVISLRSFRRRRHYENAARIEHALPDLYRQIDTQDFVFAEREASSTRGNCAGISEASPSVMLTRTLRNLESTRLISRRVTGSKAIAVEYSLTQLGRTIIAPLRGMCCWAKRYCRAVSADVHLPQEYEVQ
jgi:hypothetical protein